MQDVPLGLKNTISVTQIRGNQPSSLLTLDGKHTTQYAQVEYLTQPIAEATGARISLLVD